MDAADLAAFLAKHPPFDSVSTAALEAMAQGSRADRFAARVQRIDGIEDLPTRRDVHRELRIRRPWLDPKGIDRVSTWGDRTAG